LMNIEGDFRSGFWSKILHGQYKLRELARTL
jgi:hypothetical protein